MSIFGKDLKETLKEHENKKFTAGSLISIECGEYSDYSVLGFFVVLNEFFPVEQVEAYLEKYPSQNGDYHFSNDKFLYYLISNSFLFEVRHGVFYLGGYDDIAEMRVELVNGALELEMDDTNECPKGHFWYGNDLVETCPECKKW